MKNRMILVAFALTWGIIVSAGRIGWIATGEQYLQTAENQSLYTLTVDHPRGTVFDRNGEALTNCEPVYRGVLTPTPQVVSQVQTALTGQKREQILTQLAGNTPFAVTLSEAFEAAGATLLSCFAPRPNRQLAVHLIGYTDTQGKTGITGLQLAYDRLLAGDTPSTVTVAVAANGGALLGVAPEVTHNTAIYNQGVITTLDKTIQQLAEDVFPADTKGCILISKQNQLLASASFPSFSPAALEKAMESANQPLRNRPFASYNVGSVFKLVVAAAALEAGISPQTAYTCTGHITAGVTFACHEKEGHGTLTMGQALAVSCNTYFIDLAAKVGAERVYAMATALGLGQSQTLCNGMVTEAGNLPRLAELAASPAALANFAIGQGELMATPLQIHTVTQTIVNGGEYTLPRLILGTVDRAGTTTKQPVSASRQVMSRETAGTLQTMMAGVMTQGTATAGVLPGIPSAGKTATAQTGIVNARGEGVTQAWFTGTAQIGGEGYVVTVLVEEGESGGGQAAPLFKEICRAIAALAR